METKDFSEKESFSLPMIGERKKKGLLSSLLCKIFELYFQIYCCCTGMANSLLCCTCCLILMTVLLLLSIIIYSFTTSNIWSIEYNESERSKDFKEMDDMVSDLIINTQYAVTEITGLSRQIAELFHAGEYDMLVGTLSPYSDILLDKFTNAERETLCFCVYTYVIGPHWDNRTYFAFEDCEGAIYLTNMTHQRVIDSLTPESPGYNFENHTFTVEYFEEVWPYDESVYYDSGTYPYMSYTYGTGVLDEIGPDWDEGVKSSVNIWFGLPIHTLSQHFLAITPNDSFTFLVELQYESLVAVSDSVEMYELYDEETGALVTPGDYKGNERVGEIYEILMKEENREKWENKDEPQTFDVQGNRVTVHHYDYADLGGEFLVVNVKSVWKINENVFITVIVVVVVFYCCFQYLCCCWCCFILRVACDVCRLDDGMRKAKKMKLDNLRVGCCYYCCTFFEILYIRQRFQSLVVKLKEYRTFLPETLVNVENKRGKMFSELLQEDDDDVSDMDESGDLASSSGDLTSGDLASANSSTGTASDSASLSSFDSARRKILRKVRKGRVGFALGVCERDIVGIMIVFGNDNMTRFLDKMYQIILDRKRSDMMFEFGFDRVTIYINSENKVIFGMNIIQSIQDSMKTKGIQNVRYFLCKDVTYFGNLGSRVLKKSVVGGPIKRKLDKMYNEASPVIRIMKDGVKGSSDLQFFVCNRCKGVMKNKFELRKLPTGNIWECGSHLKVKDNEWMYELEQKSELCRWNVYNKAVDCFSKKDYVDSKKLFLEYKGKFEDDEPTILWLKKVEEKIKMTVVEGIIEKKVGVDEYSDNPDYDKVVEEEQKKEELEPKQELSDSSGESDDHKEGEDSDEQNT